MVAMTTENLCYLIGVLGIFPILALSGWVLERITKGKKLGDALEAILIFAPGLLFCGVMWYIGWHAGEPRREEAQKRYEEQRAKEEVVFQKKVRQAKRENENRKRDEQKTLDLLRKRNSGSKKAQQELDRRQKEEDRIKEFMRRRSTQNR
jgi:hypothetical protein